MSLFTIIVRLADIRYPNNVTFCMYQYQALTEYIRLRTTHFTDKWRIFCTYLLQE